MEKEIKHKKHKMRITSLLAYSEVLENLEGRQREVYRALRELKSANNTTIADYLKLPINTIVPRVYELRKLGLVIFHKKDICSFTKKLTTFWKVRREL